MADRIWAAIHADQTVKDFRKIQRQTDRATQQALRAVGRLVKQDARRHAPVYQGERSDVVPGLLKNSIKSSRRIKRLGGGVFSITVGPRGYLPHLYAGKQEERTPYMKPAERSAVSQAREIHEKAWGRVMKQ